MEPLSVNSRAPDFTLLNQVGQPVTLSDLVRLRKVLIIFYPSDWGMTCFHEMSTFRDMQAEFEKAGCQLIGISYNSTHSHGMWHDSLKLRFPLLSDPESKIMTCYGVMTDDVESFNVGRSERALFMVNQDMIITWTWLAKTVWNEPDYQEVLKAAQEGPSSSES
jgi:peroxiredoxin